MSPQEFIFRHNLINYLDEKFTKVDINDKDIDDLTIQDNDGLKTNINTKEIYQDFLQSSKNMSEYFDSIWHSIEYALNNEKEREGLELD